LRVERAFTFVEILVVMGIIAILSGLTFALMEPARESARQAHCSANLKQIYSAIAQYSADFPGPELSPGLGDIQFSPDPIGGYMPYLKSKDVFFCPDGPSDLKKKYGSTYVMPLLSSLNPDLRERVGSLPYQLLRKGPSTPIVQCTVHDEYYYAPRENVDPAYARPFLVEVWLDGSVHAGRTDDKRTNRFKDVTR
jgi:prepilin-type N-terminal cleavage/methylation domain-containing protein